MGTTSLIQIIEQIIIQDYKEKILNNNFELKEDSKSAKCRKAKFKATSKPLIYKFDKSLKYDRFPFFTKYLRVNAMADYIIFYKKDNRIFAISCNLKSGNKANNHDQLEAGTLFSEFIAKTAQRLDNTNHHQIIYKQIVFSSRRLYKSCTNNNYLKKIYIKNYVSNDEHTDICDLDSICHPN